jgi:nucleoside-diphosphate-sugar epimerase
MRVCVVGGTGALGRRIVPLLLDAGHAVTALGRSAERLQSLAWLGAATVDVDLFDPRRMRIAVAGHDAVINVATRVPSPSRMFTPGGWRAMNRVRSAGSANVADAVIAGRVERLVQESFAPIYPDCGDSWITERTPAVAARYNRSVLDAERSAERVRKAGGVAVILRFGLLYGSDDPFAEQVIGSIRKGWAPFVGSRRGYLALVTQDDAARAAVAALSAPAGVYNVVDDDPMTRDALATGIAGLLGVDVPRFLPPWAAYLAGSLGETLARSQRVSNQALRDATGWRPLVPNALEGFRRILAH